MVYFFCALYEEAQFLIEAFQLKKNPEIHAFPIYESRKEMHPELTLVITGPGAIPAATAVGYLAARDDRREEGLLINIGSCGGGEKFPVGTVTLGNKLWNETTGRSYYPDILFRHPFREVEIRTGSAPAFAEKITIAGIKAKIISVSQILIVAIIAKDPHKRIIDKNRSSGP
mgnify:CR=1 FL=1